MPRQPTGPCAQISPTAACKLRPGGSCAPAEIATRRLNQTEGGRHALRGRASSMARRRIPIVGTSAGAELNRLREEKERLEREAQQEGGIYRKFRGHVCETLRDSQHQLVELYASAVSCSTDSDRQRARLAPDSEGAMRQKRGSRPSRGSRSSARRIVSRVGAWGVMRRSVPIAATSGSRKRQLSCARLYRRAHRDGLHPVPKTPS